MDYMAFAHYPPIYKLITKNNIPLRTAGTFPNFWAENRKARGAI